MDINKHVYKFHFGDCYEMIPFRKPEPGMAIEKIE
jgi:hypothetical protein